MRSAVLTSLLSSQDYGLARVLATASTAPPSARQRVSPRLQEQTTQGSWHCSAVNGEDGARNTGPLETRLHWSNHLKTVTC